jgi:hypothetical protein
MSNLKVIPYASTSKERIEAKIESFKKDFLSQEGDLETANMLISVVIEYLSEFEYEHNLDQAYLKLGESHYYIDKYMYS